MSHILYEEHQSFIAFIHYKHTIDCPQKIQVSEDRHIVPYKLFIHLCEIDCEILPRWQVESRFINVKKDEAEKADASEGEN